MSRALAIRALQLVRPATTQAAAAAVAGHRGSWQQHPHFIWRQAQFGSQSAGGGGGGKAPDDQQAGQDEQPTLAAANQEREKAQPDSEAAASRPASSPDQPTSSAASSAKAPPSSSKESADEQAAPASSSLNPDLQQYIQQLKKLKGSSTVLKQEVGVERLWWQTLLQNWVGGLVQGWIGDFLRSRIDESFDVEDTLEGAKDAYWMVHQLVEQEDWDTLRPMTSAKLFNAFRETVDAYKADGLVWRTAVSQDLEAGIRGLGFATKQQMAAFAPEQAELAPDDASLLVRPGGMFLVLTIQIRGRQQVTISRQEDGHIVAELTDKRPVRWKFARGPLPSSLPTDRLECPWFLLSI